MVFGRKMLGVVVSEVLYAGFPVDVELVLVYTVTDPVESHIDGFGPSLFDGVVDDAGGAGVVDLDWCGRLRPSHFKKGGADRACILGIVKTSAYFGFGGGRHDVA